MKSRALTWRRFFAWGLYVLGVTLAFEGLARLALSSDALRERLFTNDDASWRLQWVARQGAQGRLHYALDEWSATRGWTLRARLEGVPFRGKTVSTNANGLRGSRDFGYEKPEGSTRLVVLGDSFTFGEEVGDHETFSHYLQERLPNSEVLNLGVHGYGHDQMLIYLKEEGIKYHPDVVLLGFMPDDMERNVLSFRDYAKPRYAVRDGRLTLVTGPVPRPEDTLAAEAWRSKFGDLLTMAWSRYQWRSGETSKMTRELTNAILDEMKVTAEAAGATPVFAYLPVYGEIPRVDEGMTFRERSFFSYCQQRGMDCLYLQPFYREKVRRGIQFKTEGHWSPLEHLTAAEGISQLLTEKGLVPAR